MAVAARTARPEFGAIKNTNLIKYNAAIHNFVKHPCAPPWCSFFPDTSVCLAGWLAVGWLANYFTVIMHLKHAVTISASLS